MDSASRKPRILIGWLVCLWAAGCAAPARPPARSSRPSDKGGGVVAESPAVEAVRPLVEREATRQGLPEDLVYGVIYVESRFNPNAVSPVGARGLMQLMPGTARYLGKLLGRSDHDPLDPEFNIEAGCFYLGKLLREWNGDETLALASYNAGSTNVKRWLDRRGEVPEEVANYAMAVEAARLRFRGPGEAPALAEGEFYDREGLSALIRRKNEEALRRAESEDLSKLIQNLEETRFQQYRPDDIDLDAPKP